MSAPHMNIDGCGRVGWRRHLSTLGPLLGLLGVYLVFVFRAPPSFATAGNLQTIMCQTTIVGIAALGMTMVIISGGIDLSVGSTIALTTVMVAWLLDAAGVGPLLAGLGGILAGAAVGLVIGLLVTRVRIVPFIATLGMMLLVRGAAKGIAREQKIDAPMTWLADLLRRRPAPDLSPAARWFVEEMACVLICMAGAVLAVAIWRALWRRAGDAGKLLKLPCALLGVAGAAGWVRMCRSSRAWPDGLLFMLVLAVAIATAIAFVDLLAVRKRLSGFRFRIAAAGLVLAGAVAVRYLCFHIAQWPPGVSAMLLLALLVAGVLKYTRFGRHVFAIGSNEQTARLCGIRVAATKVALYAASGALIGVAGVMQFSRLTVGDPTVAIGKELDVIAAVVIGGGSLSGGEGSVAGSLIGALIMTVIRSGCSQMGLPNWVQEIVTGMIIVLAVALDRLRRRRAHGRHQNAAA